VVDPNDPNASNNKQLIDWDLAQTELSEALGSAVDLKVEEEVAKKKAELDAQLKAMEEKFKKENEELKKKLSGGRRASTAQQATLKQMDVRGEAIEAYKTRIKIHLSEYKRELIRLEESLKKLMPLIDESNVLADQLGRGVHFAPTLMTIIPQTASLSPVEELLTQKMTDLLVRVLLSNPRTNEKRFWMWPPELFYERVAHMRNTWQDWMLKSQAPPSHTPADPFWSPPRSQHVGDAYVYLAPVAYGVAMSMWTPIYNYRAERMGEVRVHIKPKTEKTEDPWTLLKKEVRFELVIESARGLSDCPNKGVYIEFLFGEEDFKHKTQPGTGKKFEPKFGYTEELVIPMVRDVDLAYLCKDAICLSLFGEADDVVEAEDNAMVMDVPPEVFDAFIAYDVRPASSTQSASFDAGVKAHFVAQETPYTIVLGVGQENKNFKVNGCGRVFMGNVREQGGAVVDTAWTALPITKQSRGGMYQMKPWMVECTMATLPAKCVAGKVYKIDLKMELQEVERIGVLEEPLEVKIELTFKVFAKGAGTTVTLDDNELKQRFGALTTQQEVFLGHFEVSDDSVNAMMQKIREAAHDSGMNAQKVLAEQTAELDKLKQAIVSECFSQYDALSLHGKKSDLELAESLALWQLPSELLGGAASEKMPDDPAELKQLLGDTRKELQEAKQRIALLESELVQAKKNAPASVSVSDPVGKTGSEEASAACVIL